ncbi:MAG: TIM barrel protein, partial [Clostridiales bacterium]
MLNIGCHLSASKGFLAMGQEALKIKANTFQFFTRNPRGGKAKEMDPKDAQGLMELLKEHNFAQILAHAPYTLNPCSAKPEVREFAHEIMADDLNRMEFTPHNLYNFHPGSHTTQTKETGIEQIIALLNTILKPQQSTIVLLETMSG